MGPGPVEHGRRPDPVAAAAVQTGHEGGDVLGRRVGRGRVRRPQGGGLAGGGGSKEIRTLEVPTFPGWVAVAADAGVVAAGESSGRLQAWKYDTGTEVMSVREPHGFRPYHAAATGTWLVTAGEDRWLKVWDLRAGKEHVKWRLERSPGGVAVSADGRTAVVWYDEGTSSGCGPCRRSRRRRGRSR